MTDGKCIIDSERIRRDTSPMAAAGLTATRRVTAARVALLPAGRDININSLTHYILQYITA